jgi:hypothetical protein
MAIRLSEPPDTAGEVADSALRSFVTSGRYRLRTLEGKSPETIARAQPHPVYTLGLQDIASGRGLPAATLTSWRFLLQESGNTVAAIELAVDKQSGAMSFAGVNTGPFVDSTAAALGPDLAQLTPDPGDWAVRLLRIPALYLWAVWLADTAANKNLLSPLEPAPDGIQAGRAYSWDELNQILLPLARSRLAADNTEPGRP